MDKAAQWRWTVLATALVATIAAIFYPVEEDVSMVTTASQSLPASTKQTVAKAEVAGEQQAPWIATQTDPFAPRGWVAAPPAPAPAAAPMAVATVETAEAPPAPPPPLPYKFVGQMRDGSDTVVYLSLGEQMVLARSGETLDGGYKVAAITASQIEFESVAQGVRQTLPIPTQD